MLVAAACCCIQSMSHLPDGVRPWYAPMAQDTLEATLTLRGHTGSVLCCGINETGTRIISSGEDCTIRLWSLDGKQLQVRAKLRASM